MPDESDVCPPITGKRRSRERGRAVAELAARQHGVVGRWQLRERGFTDSAINEWIDRSRLIVVHRGTFAVGRRPLTVAGRCMAGVLAGGPRAALSERPAAWMWDLRDSIGGPVHVVVPTDRRSRSGLVFHQRSLPLDELTTRDGIPITTTARTILDAAANETAARLRQMVALAESRGLGDSPSLPELLERYPRSRGSAVLRSILAGGAAEGVAKQELELGFAEFIDEIGAPRPLKNEPVEVAGGRQLIVDCLWPDARLVVELDSRRHHSDWEAAEADRARDAALIAVGLTPMRVTWRRLYQQRSQLARELLTAIARGRRLPAQGR